MTARKDLPLVSIITPSYNQADFLEQTILSVLEQDYPNIEYLVVDGGSTDGSVEIIKKYAGRIDWWVSEKDKGQADALNKGLARAKGEIVAWLNSDDIYRPGAIRQAVEALHMNPEVGMVYSKLHSIDRAGEVFNTISYKQFDLLDLLTFQIIGQPTVFMRRAVLQQAGPLDASYNYLLDHHLWLRMLRLAPIKYVNATWAAARHHPSAKNVAQATRFGQEAFRILDWARAQPVLSELVAQNSRTVRGGAHRLDARYLLDGGEPGLALKAYGRVLMSRPSFAFKHWHRMLFALLSLMGLDWLRPLVLYRKISNHRPILVTGPHRSGTTWVGRMLSVNGDVAYVSEPLNVWHRFGVFEAPVAHWYTYVCKDNEAEYLPAFRETLKLNYHFWKEVKSLRSVRDFLRMLRDLSIFIFGRLGHRRVLMKDPFAVFSVPWFAERLDCEVVIVLRHPAAFVSSLKRLDWPFDFKDLLAQPLLMRDWLEPFRTELEAAVQNPRDVIGQGSLLWRLICHVSYQVQQRDPKLHVVLHEELSLQPMPRYEDLYAKLEMPFTGKARRGILKATSAKNPQEVSLDSIYSTNLDSAANLENWKQRLSPEEIARIRDLTQDVARIYYGDQDWD
jgi:glycosyltransferase involved in cell wall biosynthesis